MRRVFGVVLLAVLVGSAGCLGFITGSEPLEGEASQATVEDDTLATSGYELKDERSQELERTVEFAGQERKVRVVNQITEYHRGVDLGPVGTVDGAVFAILTTPAFEVVGQTINPVGSMSSRDIAERAQDQYSGINVGTFVENETVETLDDEMTLSKFEAEASIEGESVPVYLHVGKVKHGEDFVIVLAIYPRQVDGEEERVFEMVRNLDHPE